MSLAEGERSAPRQRARALVIVNAAEVVTCRGASSAPARGADAGALGVLRGAAVALRDGRIAAVGPERDVRREFAVGDAEVVDAEGGVVLPGFVDCHAHLVFAGDRCEEWEARLAGKTYLELLREGGGIRRTVEATRAATEDALVGHARRWARRALEHGTTTLEAKSGYCLEREGELKLLRVTRALAGEASEASSAEARLPRLVSTYLGAHVVPAELAARREDYVELVLRLLPELRASGLAEFVDVFCEEEAFSLDETRRILTAARGLGFGLKLHAEQLSASGAVQLGVELGVTSVDHLERLGESSFEALARSAVSGRGPVAVLLPAAAFHLATDDAPPARRLIEAGVPLALATDFNPGSAFTPSMPMVIALATRRLKLSVAEALVACTVNAAHALGLEAVTGSLEVGKRADVLICDVPDHRWLGYAFGWNPVNHVFVNGETAR